MFLLDTNVVSEPTKLRPHRNVVSWLQQQASNDIFVSVITICEIVRGVEQLPASGKREKLSAWLEAMGTPIFFGTMLDVTLPVAVEWGRMQARHRHTLPRNDALIAATALVYNLTVVTRNERDFAGLSVRVVNPWT